MINGNSSVGFRIRHFRRSRHLSRVALAELTRISESTITSWELEKRTPKFENILLLAGALKVEVEAIDPFTMDKVKRVNALAKKD